MNESNNVQPANTERPLITLALFAYNQEWYIREAVEGALSQTYSPLQIILSDDCSSDRTFEIMQEIVGGYQGPHKLVVNRRSKNGGLAAHINKVMQLVEGEIVVGAAGDDVSFPERVNEITQAWIKTGRSSGSIYSNYVEMSADGKATGRVRTGPVEHDFPRLIRNAAAGGRGVFGCTHAWTPDVFSVFGDLDPRTVYEDKVIPFRSALIGKITHVNIELVKYRVLTESLSHSVRSESYVAWVKMVVRNWSNRLVAFEDNLKDLELAYTLHIIQPDIYSTIRDLLSTEIARCKVRLEFLQGGIFNKLRIIIKSGDLFDLRQRAKWVTLCIAPWVMDRRFQSIHSVFLNRR